MIGNLQRAPGLRGCRFTAGEPETFYRRFTVLAQRGYTAEPVRVEAQRTVGSLELYRAEVAEKLSLCEPASVSSIFRSRYFVNWAQCGPHLKNLSLGTEE